MEWLIVLVLIPAVGSYCRFLFALAKEKDKERESRNTLSTHHVK